MNDSDFCVRHRVTTSNQRADVQPPVGGLHDAVMFKRCHLGCAQGRLIFHKPTRNNQSGFGESITGIEEVWLETTGGKGRAEPSQGVRADRLSTVVRHLPTA